ncbi:MAG: hypothetical protein D3919_11185 [Candidatus Electrothrix sp. AW5]|nr:hypothetical protein [Candidatus Electrothrix gigas]
MFKKFLEEQIWSDLKYRSKLFVSLFKNKDTNSALLWIAGISILFFSLPNIISLLLFPAALALYILVAYQLLLSFVSFKITAFNAQMQFKDSSSGWLSKYISQYISQYIPQFVCDNKSNLIESLIKDVIKSIWSAIFKKLATTFKKIRSGGILQKIQQYKKFTIQRKKDGLLKKMARSISKSHSHFWQFVLELVVLCIPSNSDGKGFTDNYLNILFIFYYTIPLKILKKVYSLFIDFIINLPSILISFLLGIPGLLCDLFAITIINIFLKIIFIPIGIIYAFLLIIVSFISSTGSIFVLLYSIVRFPFVLYQFIKQIVLFLKGLTLDRVMHWFLAVSLLSISIVLPLLSFRFEFPIAIPEQLILSISELSAILAICVFVMISGTVTTQKAYLSSLVVLCILTAMYGAYFVLLALLLWLYFTIDPRKKTAYVFFYLVCLYLIKKIGFADAYSETFYRGGMVLLVATDYEGDVEYPSFLFLALHGSYQELEQSLNKRFGLYDEHTETTVESVNSANNYNRTTDTCYRNTGNEGMTSNAYDEVITQPTAMLLDRGKRIRLSRRSAFHKSRKRRNPYGLRRRRSR